MLPDDESWFELIDSLDEASQARLIGLSGAGRDRRWSRRRTRRLERQVWTKLALQSAGQRRGWRRRSTSRALNLTAALAALVIALAIVPGPVSAALKRMLAFIPGLGMVQQTEGDTGTAVLAAPVNGVWYGTRITVDGMMVTSTEILIKLSGTGFEAPPSVSFRAGGHVYKMGGSVGSSDSAWMGEYGYRGQVGHIVAGDVLVGPGSTTRLPVRLIPARTVQDLRQLGPTETHHGVTIAAVTSRIGTTGELTFLSKVDGPFQIMHYSTTDLQTGALRLRIRDAAGRTYSASSDLGFESANQFTFQPRVGQDRYRVTLPQVSATFPGDASVTLPIPAVGRMSLNRTILLAGFPVTFTSVRWVRDPGPEIRIGINLHASLQAAEELYSFTLGTPGLTSWSSRMAPKTDAMIWMQIPVSPGQRAVTLHLTSPQVYIRGPWNFNVTLPKGH